MVYQYWQNPVPLHYCWDDPAGSILRVEFRRPWSWVDCWPVMSAIQQAIGQKSHRVDVIFVDPDIEKDARLTPHLPQGSPWDLMRHYNSTPRAENWGLLVLAGRSMLLQIILSTQYKWDEHASRFLRNAANLADAREIIQRSRSQSVMHESDARQKQRSGSV